MEPHARVSSSRPGGVVNASGPWVGKTLEPGAGADVKHHVRLVRGSHIVVEKLFDHPHPYIFQTGDGRVLFAIPFEEAYTLLGTTEVEMQGDPGPVAITPGEVDYICATANTYFKKPLSPGDVVMVVLRRSPLARRSGAEHECDYPRLRAPSRSRAGAHARLSRRRGWRFVMHFTSPASPARGRVHPESGRATNTKPVSAGGRCRAEPDRRPPTSKRTNNPVTVNTRTCGTRW